MLSSALTASHTLPELRALYLVHAAAHYRRRSGAPTREHLNMRAVIDRFISFAGEASPAARINRHQVRAWLDQLAAEKLSRSYCNACLSKLRRFVRWCADLEHIPISIDAALRLVRPLQPFRSTARESAPPSPPPLSAISKLLPFLPAQARHVLHLSTLTGARPSELLELTNAEVHLDSRPRLTPLQHKCAHHGQHRVIPLNSTAVALIERIHRPLCPGDFLFPSPRNRRGHYTIEGFRASIARACTRAGLPIFTPYAVRHAVARHVRTAHGLDAAQALLGHSNSSTTEIYAPLQGGDARAFNAASIAAEGLR